MNDFPPVSPDLNVIENLFSLWKGQVRKRQPNDINSLKTVAVEEWSRVNTEICRSLVHSMPRRIASVIKGRGNITKYQINKLINYNCQTIPYC